MSLRSKLLIGIGLLFAAGLGVTAVVTISAVRADMIEKVDTTITQVSRRPPPTAVIGGPQPGQGAPHGFDSIADVPAQPDPPIDPGPPDGAPDPAQDFAELALVTYGPDGRITSAAPSGFRGDRDSLPALPDDAADLPRGEIFNVEGLDGSLRYRAIVAPMSGGGDFVVAAPLSAVDSTFRLLVIVWIITGIVVLALLIAGGWFVIRRDLKPVEAMADTAGEIAAGDLTRRVEHADDKTELGRLGTSLNTMLGQIETAFAAQRDSEDRLRRFVADASHELRTPVTAIRGYAELYQHGALDDTAELDMAIGRIESEALRMGDLVEDLLLLARLDQGRPLEREIVDLLAVCEDVVADTHAIDPGRDIRLEATAGTDAPDGTWTVTGDPGRLHQVIQILVTNARVHGGPDAVVTIRLSELSAGSTSGVPAGASSPAAEGRLVLLEVADTGHGLSPEEAAHVFDRFYRSPSARAETSGSGLGLSIAQSVVTAHGGQIRFDSRLGSSTRVSISLPATGMAV